MDTLIRLFINKTSHKAVKAIITFLISGIGADYLKQAGVTIEPIALQAALIALIESGRNLIKRKFKVGWL